MSPFSHSKPPCRLVFSSTRSVFLFFLLLALIGSACSAPDSRPVPVLSPLSFQNPAGDAAPVRAPSAMEAMSRGIAAVTPPGAALQDVYYEFDSTDLAVAAQAILKQNADWLKNNPKSRVEVEGHCDDLGSNEYNLALGAKRAQRAKDFLVNQGIAAERLVTISYGKEAPACFEPTDECRVKNRRARFVIFTELPTS
jgi:peptidoglycan-associated lipoprotein